MDLSPEDALDEDVPRKPEMKNRGKGSTNPAILRPFLGIALFQRRLWMQIPTRPRLAGHPDWLVGSALLIGGCWVTGEGAHRLNLNEKLPQKSLPGTPCSLRTQ